MDFIPNYEILFRRYKYENPEKNEVDFITESISRFKKEVEKANAELEEADLDKIREAIKEEYPPDYQIYPNTGYPVDWLEGQVEQKIQPITNKKKHAEKMISEYNIRLSRLPGSHHKSDTSTSLYVKGKKLNSSERFEIANKSVDLWNSINNMNIRASQKYRLLGLILGINEDNAKKLVNGKYSSKDRPDLIQSFLEDLKKQ